MKIPRIDRTTDALIVVDIQRDFCPPLPIPRWLQSDFGGGLEPVGGALAVPDGDKIISVVNSLMPQFDIVIATQDWHPKHHVSFASSHAGKQPGETILINGEAYNLWPDHCVADTKGADFHPDLRHDRFTHIVRKAYSPQTESYSGFSGTGMAGTLSTLKMKRVFICGLATDYCVKATALDAHARAFKTFVILPACRGVTAETTESAIEEMRAAGIQIITEL